MPFLEDDAAPIDLANRIDVPKGFAVTPGAADLDPNATDAPRWNWGAAFRQNNELAALASSESAWIGNEPEEGFNPWDKIKGTADEVNFARFAEARNQRKFDAIKADIIQETEDKKLLASQPWWMGLITEGAASIASPTTLLPGGSFVKGAKGGIAIARGAASVGMAAGVATAAQEGMLHSIQQTRTATESATAIGSSLFLGGLLGAAGGLLSRGEWQKGIAALDHELANPRPVLAAEDVLQAANSNDLGLRSVGAAANTAADIADNTIAGRAAQMTAAATAKMNPLLRILHSPSAEARDLGINLFENPLYLKKNFEGVASQPAVETLMKEYNGGLASSIKATDEAFKEHRKAGGQLDRSEFREAVGKAMRRGDTDPDPAVAKAAAEWRAKVFDPLKEQAIAAKLLPDDVSVDTAASYFTRMWNGRAIAADEAGFKEMVNDWVAQNAPKWTKQFDDKTERRLNPIRQEIEYQEMAKLRRAEELKQRTDVADTSEMSEADIRQALRIVQGKAPRPKGVKTLSQFVLEAGGLVDDAGELASRGITNKARPGLIRKEARSIGGKSGGWTLDDMARHAWENDYFPDHINRPSIDEFVEALNDDFHKVRAVLKRGDQGAFELNDYIARLEADLSRAGVGVDGKAPRFATSEEMKGAVERVYKALDAESDRKIAALKDRLSQRETDARVERESRFVGDPKELGRSIADEVFDTLTGRTGTNRPAFITVKSRGPLKERTFNIPDLFTASNGRAVEQYLEHDVEHVGRRYTRIMGADVEMARKFGSVDLKDQLQKIRDEYRGLRQGVTDEKQLKTLGEREAADIRDLEAVRDMLRGTNPGAPTDSNYARIVRSANHVNYLRQMGEVALASLSETVRPAMVHGLLPYMETLGQTLTNLKGVRLSVKEAQIAGTVTERVLGTRLATLSDIMDPYASRGPIEAFLENMTNIGSKWNGIRLLTDMQKAISAVMTQNRILKGVEKFSAVAEKERAYLAYLGIDESMAGRIAKQFAEHGETVDKVRVANQERWTDEVAARYYRAAISKDVDSIITTKGVADTPLFANTPTGRAMLQFQSFALASHQRVLLRGLQEGQARFVGGLVAMSTIGMMATWFKAVSGNRVEKLEDISKNPGWWISEGIDRSGVFSVPIQLANMFEKATNFNPIKTPMKAFDEGSAISQKLQNRNAIGTFLGPSYGLGQDVLTIGGLPRKLSAGEDLTQGDKNAMERMLPYNSYPGIRQMLRYVVNPQTN
jgi:hypothetical protein